MTFKGKKSVGICEIRVGTLKGKKSVGICEIRVGTLKGKKSVGICENCGRKTIGAHFWREPLASSQISAEIRE